MMACIPNLQPWWQDYSLKMVNVYIPILFEWSMSKISSYLMSPRCWAPLQNKMTIKSQEGLSFATWKRSTSSKMFINSTIHQDKNRLLKEALLQFSPLMIISNQNRNHLKEKFQIMPIGIKKFVYSINKPTMGKLLPKETLKIYRKISTRAFWHIWNLEIKLKI